MKQCNYYKGTDNNINKQFQLQRTTLLVQYDKNEFQFKGNNFLEYIQYQIRFCIVETIFCLLDTILCIIENTFVRDIVNNFLSDRNHCVLAYVRKLQLVKTFPRLVEPTFLHMESFFWLVKTNLSSVEVSMQFLATVFRLIDMFTLPVETFLLLIILYVMHFILALKRQKISQETFTCSNSTIKTLEKGVKYIQS